MARPDILVGVEVGTSKVCAVTLLTHVARGCGLGVRRRTLHRGECLSWCGRAEIKDRQVRRSGVIL